MPALPVKDSDFLTWLKSRLSPEISVDPNNDLYVPVIGDPSQDPVSLILNDITRSGDSSLNFLSGFSGSGKTSQLLRLKNELLARGFFVAYSDASDYFLPTRPVSIELLLISLAGAFSDALEKDHNIRAAHESYWKRIVHWITSTRVKVEGFDLEAKAPGTDIGVTFKTLLKENPSFIQKLQEQMALRPKELRDQVHEFFRQAVALVRGHYGAQFSPVFIFDQFEQLHDSANTGGSVAESIITIVNNHQDDLAIVGQHMVVTMPPWLKLVTQNLRRIRFIYSVKLWRNFDNRPVHRPGLEFLREVIRRRFTDKGLDRFFGLARGKGTRTLVDRFIHVSGGHLRDLIILLNEVIIRADRLPVGKKEVDATINDYRNSYPALSLSQARCLNDIDLHRICTPPDHKPETLYALTQLLNTHCALILRNGEEWYDVHPVVRDKVKEILRRYEPAAPPQD